MPRSAAGIAASILVLAAAASAQTDLDYKPFHPPLDCMKRFKLKQYALVGFFYRHRGNRDYGEAFMTTARGAGFNVLMDGAVGLDAAEKTGMKLLVAAIWYDRDKLQALGDKVFKHPACIGFNLWDNASGIPRQSLGCANWLKAEHPGLIAYIAENPNAGHQSRTPMRVLSTQNYAFGYNNTGPDDMKRRNFCNSLEIDRKAANRLNMTFWPIFASLAQSTVGETEIRFQTYAPIAYGAQGAVSFAYSVTRPQWKVKAGQVYKWSAAAGKYVHEVVGRHVIGCRSVGVFHTPNYSDLPFGWQKPATGKLIEKMDPALLAGVLVVEDGFENFKAGRHKPAYVMVVDKRTVYASRKTPPDRTVHIEFGPGADVVEILEPKTGTDADVKKLRHIEPAWIVPVRLEAGGGRLLRINPPGLEETVGDEAAETYVTIVKTVKSLREKVAGGKLTADAFEKGFAEVNGGMARLEKAVRDRGDAPSKHVLARLKAAVTRVREAAYRPAFVCDGFAFTKPHRVELRTPLLGTELWHTRLRGGTRGTDQRYTRPFVVDETATLVAWTKPSGKMISAAADFIKVNGDVGAGLKINFQPRGEAPKGSLPDFGEVFGARPDARAYGWTLDRTSSARRRNRSQDPFKRTQVGFVPNCTWEIVLENGTYDVTVCVGDVDHGIWNATLVAEDVEFFKDVKLGRGQNHIVAKTVQVKDGRLTLTSHARPRGERVTRINFLEIKKK